VTPTSTRGALALLVKALQEMFQISSALRERVPKMLKVKSVSLSCEKAAVNCTPLFMNCSTFFNCLVSLVFSFLGKANQGLRNESKVANKFSKQLWAIARPSYQKR
jgi:hypothetical protein